MNAIKAVLYPIVGVGQIIYAPMLAGGYRYHIAGHWFTVCSYISGIVLIGLGVKYLCRLVVVSRCATRKAQETHGI